MTVEDLVRDKHLTYKVQGNDVLISCLNPDHQDNNPSLRIDKLTGVGHCFACGFKVNLYKYYGLVADLQASYALKLKEKIAAVMSQSVGLEIPSGAQPFIRDFKGIPSRIMREFEAFTHKDFEDRIVVPLRDPLGKITCFIGRHVLPGGEPRYKNYPKGVQVPLFPSKVRPVKGTIFLVEGMYDMLKLYSCGVTNVVAAMGTQTFKSSYKEKALDLKLQGVHRVLVLFDGDKPGRDAAKVVVELLQSAGLIADAIDLPDGVDPNDLDHEDIQRLRTYL